MQNLKKMESIYDFMLDDIKIFKKNKLPRHLELHLPPKNFNNLCWCNCSYCYGQIYRTKKTTDYITKDEVLKIIRETSSKINKFIFSGIYTDPLYTDCINDSILEVKRNIGNNYGVHSKGIEFNNGLIYQLTEYATNNDYISINLDTVDEIEFYKITKTQEFKNILNAIKINVKKLAKIKQRNNSPLRIIITTVLTNLNTNISSIEKLINFCDCSGVDVLRFTLPQNIILSKTTQENQNIPQQIINLINSYKKRISTEIIIFEKPYLSNTDSIVSCYSQFLYPTIGCDGYVYPCCQVAHEYFNELRIGDCKKENFWNIWNTYQENNENRMKPITSCWFSPL